MLDAAMLEHRALAFCLGARLTSLPDEGFVRMVDVLLASGAGEPVPPGAGDTSALVETARGDGGLDEVRAEYLALFDNGRGHSPLYETEYGRMRGMSKGTDLADIAGFYRAFGMALSEEEGRRELHDHLAVELEFYGVLLARQAYLLLAGDRDGVEIVEDARRKFLVDHLGRLARAVAAREEVQRSPLYGGVFAWCQRLVGDECQALGVEPAPLSWFADEADAGEVCCGGSVLGPRGGQPPGPQDAVKQ
jgi:nitrate reductase assembly molybdenum cofactor insertion protein NarJ